MEHENENLENNRQDMNNTDEQHTQSTQADTVGTAKENVNGAAVGNTQNSQANGAGAGQESQSSAANNSQGQRQSTQNAPAYHSAFENYQNGQGGKSANPGGHQSPADEVHRELKKYKKISAIELVVIAVLAGLSTGLITYEVRTPDSAAVIASQQETIRSLQEEKENSSSGEGKSGEDYGQQQIPFFGGGSDEGSQDSGSEDEEEDPSSIETTVQLGIYCTEVTDEVSETYGIPSGVVVADFSEEDSNAEKAGLQKGDVITKVDDTEVTSVTQLKKALQNYEPDDKVTLTIERRSGNDYKEQTISFRLEAKEDASDNASK